MQSHEVAALPLGVGVPSDGMPVRQDTRIQAHSRLRPPQPSPLRRNNPHVGKLEKQRRASGAIAGAPMENQDNNILTTQLQLKLEL